MNNESLEKKVTGSHRGNYKIWEIFIERSCWHFSFFSIHRRSCYVSEMVVFPAKYVSMGSGCMSLFGSNNEPSAVFLFY